MYNTKTEQWEGYIYCITNKINGKKYIGQTTETIHKRWIRHINAHSNMAISKAIDKYGKENFEIKELLCATCNTKKELCDTLNYLEIVLIESNNSLIDFGYGYNITRGGANTYLQAKQFDLYDVNGKYVNSFESAEDASVFCNCSQTSVHLVASGKQSVLKNKYVFRYKGEPFDKYNVKIFPKIYRFDLNGKVTKIYDSMKEAMLDVKKNFGSCMDISKTIDNPTLLAGGFWWSTSPYYNYKGRTTEKKVCQYTKQGELIKTYNSLSECARKLSLQLSNILKVCNGERCTTGGYVFRYIDDSFDMYKTEPCMETMYNQKKVNQYDKNNIYIKTYNSVKQASESVNVKDSSLISQCCNHKKGVHTAYGYRWFYSNDELQPDKTKIIPIPTKGDVIK